MGQDDEAADAQGASEDASVSAGSIQVSLPALLYADLRPTVQNVTSLTATVTSVLRLPAVLLAVAQAGVQGVLNRWEQKRKTIPPERLQDPNPLLLYHVLDGAAKAGDEPDLHELFAQLLATASDTQAADSVRPTFADLIARMEPVDARVLNAIFTLGRADHGSLLNHILRADEPRAEQAGAEALDSELLEVSLDSLRHLGLVVIVQRPSADTISQLAEKMVAVIAEQPREGRSSWMRSLASSQGKRDVRASVAALFEARNMDQSISLTPMGRSFCRSVLLDETVEGPGFGPAVR